MFVMVSIVILLLNLVLSLQLQLQVQLWFYKSGRNVNGYGFNVLCMWLYEHLHC
jgi:hypothetical protein